MRTRFFYVSTVAALAGASLLLAGAAAAGAPEAAITGVTPKTAVVGQKLTVSGTNLNGTNSVMVGNVSASPISVDPGGLWVAFDVPSGVQPGSAMVVVNGSKVGPITIQSGSMTPQALPKPPPATPGAPAKVVVAPRIGLFSPAVAKVGSKVAVYGSNFVGVSWVKLGGITAKFSLISPTRLTFTVPKRAHSGKVSVHAAGGTGVSIHVFTVKA
jgi:large repetitive protein